MGRTLIIGGNRFMGRLLVWRLVTAGETVTTLNRGHRADPFGTRIERLHADRSSPAFKDALRGREFDAVVDFAGFNAADAQGAVDALKDRVGHYVFISSGAVYMVRQGAQLPCSEPLAESAYPGELSAPPSSPEDLPSWQYGVNKRAAEDILTAAWVKHRFPATRLRLPIVNGEWDPDRRLESYLWRILDEGPVLLPEGGNNVIRHVYSDDVVTAIATLLGKANTFGQAFNLAQDEQVPLRTLVHLLANLLETPDRSERVAEATLTRVGLSSRMVSPFSGRWASLLDPSRANKELEFRHEPLVQYLAKIVTHFLNHPPTAPPEHYARRRTEFELSHADAGAVANYTEKWDA
ncbi:MAG: NAD-dependent epimerase/dehydratase family protein [Thermaerobacter sp.]|nr:NAD-dependent epimerase/dehydratase family protein [Thermaerobacter sp.]